MPATWRDSTGGNTLTSLAKPTCVVGDKIILKSRGVDNNPPSDFSGGTTHVDDGFTILCSKTADSLDEAGGSYSGPTDPGDMACVAIQDCDTLSYGGSGSGFGTTATAPTAGSSGNGCMVTFWLSLDTNFTTPNPGGTLRENFGGTSSISTDHELWVEEGVSAPTGTRTHGLGLSDWEAESFFILDAPPAGPGTPVLTPGNGTLGVSITPTLTLTDFLENVQADTGSVDIYRASDDTLIESIDITDTGQVTFTGNDVEVELSVTLANDTTYYVQISSTAIEGIASGLHYDGIADEITWRFTTIHVDIASKVPMLRDRVKESTTTTGTGNLTLGGAPTGFESFNTAFGLNVFFFYGISSSGGSEWEVGIGHLSGSTTLVRDRVLESSNSDALVSLSSGTKDVFCTLPGAPARTTYSMSMIDASLYLQ